MDTDIKLVFHPQALRSYIEVDLCARCPRQDDKGCCGYYSPVFYPLDFYYLQQHARQVLDLIWSLPHLTILDHSVTVNSFPDDSGGYYCQFHKRDGGCQLQQEYRESICRHFVCPGIDWQREAKLSGWKDFFAELENLEIKFNQAIAEELTKQELSLRYPGKRQDWLLELTRIVPRLQAKFILPEPLSSVSREAVVRRELKYGESWLL